MVEITPARQFYEEGWKLLRQMSGRKEKRRTATGPGSIKIKKRPVANSASIRSARDLFHRYEKEGANGLDEDGLYAVISALRGGDAVDDEVMEGVQAVIAGAGAGAGAGSAADGGNVDEKAFIRWWRSAGSINTLAVAPDHTDKFSVSYNYNNLPRTS
jgi:hypothetical protein